MQTTPPLRTRIKPLVLVGLPIALARLLAPIGETSIDKFGWGLMQGLLTSLTGTIWCTVWGTLLIWVPARMRHRS